MIGTAREIEAAARALGAQAVRLHLEDGWGTVRIEILEPRGPAAFVLVQPILDALDPVPRGSGSGLLPIGMQASVSAWDAPRGDV